MHPQERYYTKNMILNLVFPPRCVSCNKTGKYICNICRSKIKYIEYQFCPVCRHPSFSGFTHPRCGNLYTLDGLFVSAHYAASVKKAIHMMKYRYVSDLVRELTLLLYPSPPAFVKKLDFLVPVPLHPRKEKDRGFNQSLLIASVMSELFKIPVKTGLLQRDRKSVV